MEFSVTEADYAAAFRQSGLTEAHRKALAKLKDNRLRCLALLEMAYVNLPAEEAERYATRVAELYPSQTTASPVSVSLPNRLLRES